VTQLGAARTARHGTTRTTRHGAARTRSSPVEAVARRGCLRLRGRRAIDASVRQGQEGELTAVASSCVVPVEDATLLLAPRTPHNVEDTTLLHTRCKCKCFLLLEMAVVRRGMHIPFTIGNRRFASPKCTTLLNLA
jgi:hypothetical protein